MTERTRATNPIYNGELLGKPYTIDDFEEEKRQSREAITEGTQYEYTEDGNAFQRRLIEGLETAYPEEFRYFSEQTDVAYSRIDGAKEWKYWNLEELPPWILNVRTYFSQFYELDVEELRDTLTKMLQDRREYLEALDTFRVEVEAFIDAEYPDYLDQMVRFRRAVNDPEIEEITDTEIKRAEMYDICWMALEKRTRSQDPDAWKDVIAEECGRLKNHFKDAVEDYNFGLRSLELEDSRYHVIVVAFLDVIGDGPTLPNMVTPPDELPLLTAVYLADTYIATRDLKEEDVPDTLPESVLEEIAAAYAKFVEDGARIVSPPVAKQSIRKKVKDMDTSDLPHRFTPTDPFSRTMASRSFQKVLEDYVESEEKIVIYKDLNPLKTRIMGTLDGKVTNVVLTAKRVSILNFIGGKLLSKGRIRDDRGNLTEYYNTYEISGPSFVKKWFGCDDADARLCMEEVDADLMYMSKLDVVMYLKDLTRGDPELKQRFLNDGWPLESKRQLLYLERDVYLNDKNEPIPYYRFSKLPANIQFALVLGEYVNFDEAAYRTPRLRREDMSKDAREFAEKCKIFSKTKANGEYVILENNPDIMGLKTAILSTIGSKSKRYSVVLLDLDDVIVQIHGKDVELTDGQIRTIRKNVEIYLTYLLDFGELISYPEDPKGKKSKQYLRIVKVERRTQGSRKIVGWSITVSKSPSESIAGN